MTPARNKALAGTDCTSILDEGDFQALTGEWNLLAEQTDDSSVFLRHEWFDAAWQWLRGHCDMQILCVRRDGRLIGILPLVVRKRKYFGIPVTTLTCLSVPDTQEFSLLASPADLPVVVAAVSNHLSTSGAVWDAIELQHMPVDLPALEEMQAGFQAAGFRSDVSDGQQNPTIMLDGGWTAYYGRRSRRLKKGNNLIANRLTREGKDVMIRCIDASTAGTCTLESVLDTLTGLSSRSWKARTGLTLDNEGPKAFIARLSRHAVRNSWFLVWILSIDNEPAAMEYQLEYHGVISGLRADFDSRYDQYSPGALLNWRIVERLFDRGATRYSLGPGNNQYKLRWAEGGREERTLTIYGNTVKGRAIRLIRTKVQPMLRKFKSGMQSSV